MRLFPAKSKHNPKSILSMGLADSPLTGLTLGGIMSARREQEHPSSASERSDLIANGGRQETIVPHITLLTRGYTMAPLPENSTARLFLDYTSMGVNHTVMIRLPSDATLGGIQQFAIDIADALRTRMLETDSFFAARLSNVGSDFSFPITFPVLPGILTVAGNVWGQDPQSTMLSIVGRSYSTGRRVRLQFFSPVSSTSWPDDNRYNPGDSAPVDTFRTNVIGTLNGGGISGVQAVAIDNTAPGWYPYVNISQNAYWQREQRG